MSEGISHPSQSSPRPIKLTAPSQTNHPKPLRPPNPIWKYLGLGANFRPRLPSRNWLIFISLTSTLTGSIIYDKRETRKVQRKWCKLVEHVGKEPLSNANAMPRKLTVYLQAPPADGLRVAQEHFKIYVKPVLVASGLDWDFVQGRIEGDVRAEVADRIRERRKPEAERRHWDDPVVKARRSQGVQEHLGVGGDIVVGRHTWKEYMRGLHEGWLGPLDEPSKLSTEESVGHTSEEQPASEQDEPESKRDETPSKPQPYISTQDYAPAPMASEMPDILDPSTAVPFPHVLGFSSTLTRFYRFLNRRLLADQIGRQTAAIILAASRTYNTSATPALQELATESPAAEEYTPGQEGAEQQYVLVEEEREWHKSARVRKENEGERVWLDSITLDPRITGRMRAAELSSDEEERANGIVISEVEVEGWMKSSLRNLGLKVIEALRSDRNRKQMNHADVVVIENLEDGKR